MSDEIVVAHTVRVTRVQPPSTALDRTGQGLVLLGEVTLAALAIVCLAIGWLGDLMLALGTQLAERSRLLNGWDDE